MVHGKIIKYTASAGSGKTHTLTGEYLLRLFANPSAYRRILAVTFTNKAAAEMKGRILDELAAIASGKKTNILIDIQRELNLSSDKARALASQILTTILGDYSRFSVGTIDSFFQRVFRAFTREIGLQSNFSIYLDHSIILKETVDDLINNLNENDELRRWLVRYAGTLFDEGKPIDLPGSIYKLSETIFSEDFKLLSDEAKAKLSDLGRIELFVSGLEAMTARFRNDLKTLGINCVAILDKYGIDDDMLKGKTRGIGKYIRDISVGEIKPPSTYVTKALQNDEWCSGKNNSGPVEAALSGGLREAVGRIAGMFEDEHTNYLSARVILKNIFMAAILTDVVKVLRNRTNSENSFVLADTGDMLMQVIGGDQTPFIYEKTGNEYDVFMIDEFQDTSMIQYRNFKPLIENSLAQGSDTLVVGDIKQSIYRWRNGDWSILGKVIANEFDQGRVVPEVLRTNWRSLPEIVKFNNSLFIVLPQILDQEFTDAGQTPEFSFSEVYSEVAQSTPEERSGGYVRISFETSDEEKNAKEKILEQLPGIIKNCQDDGYSASDFGILVRTTAEGCEILEYLTRYRADMDPEEAEKYNFNLLSGDSLLIGNSPAIRFIVSTLIRISDRENLLNRAEMIRYFLLARQPHAGNSVGFARSSFDQTEQQLYPSGYKEFLAAAGSKPLFALCEQIIDFFHLNGADADMASINFFQDQVLDFMNRRSSDLKLFTEWWMSQGYRKSVLLSGEQDALRIMTIHKAKGLQFKVVLIPFLSWKFDQKSGNLMWVQPPEADFNAAGAFPVGYSSQLAPTIFSSDYVREKAASYLDNLNLLYVAFTRASERLYGFSFIRWKTEAGAILKSGLISDIPESATTICLSGKFNPDTLLFESGSTGRSVTVRKRETLVPAEYPFYEGGKRLKLRLYGRDLMKESAGGLKSKIYYGTVLHDIFSRIRYRSDVKAAVDTAVADGFIPVEIAVKTRDMVEEMISRESVRQWFDSDLVVMTEPEILTGAGDIRRPDRIVIRDGRVTVIDYKFGEERSEHANQIAAYSALLGKMGYDVAEACLWYVETDKIVKV
jgi:ATP-dependent helicase/nuclease subunit A